MENNLVTLTTELAGRFRLRKGVVMPDGSEKITGGTDWFDNLITDRGMNAIGELASGTAPLLVACQVGTGSATPTFADTTLSNRIATTTIVTSTNSSIVVGPPRYGRRTIVFRFAQGVAAGNLTEVGISYEATANGLLYSRALIQDASGNPTVLTVLPTEFLDVEYETRLYIPTGDSPFNILVGGTPTVVTGRVALNGDANSWCNFIPRLNNTGGTFFRQFLYSGALGAESSEPSGPIGLGTGYTPTMATYVPDSYYRDYECSYGINDGNGNIRCVMQKTTMGAFQFEYNPVIPKDNTKQMTLRFRHSWARYSG